MPWESDWRRGSYEVKPAPSRCTFSRRKHFPSFPSGSGQRRGNQEVRPALGSPHFFSTEPLFLIPYGSLPAVQEVTSGASESFRRNQFSSCPGVGLAYRGS
jgi:hypothetical protein